MLEYGLKIFLPAMAVGVLLFFLFRLLPIKDTKKKTASDNHFNRYRINSVYRDAYISGTVCLDRFSVLFYRPYNNDLFEF